MTRKQKLVMVLFGMTATLTQGVRIQAVSNNIAEAQG